MNEAFSIETGKERSSILRKARQAALSALRQYEVEWTNVRFIQVSDHITYRLDTASGDVYLLRLHSPLQSREQIVSEIVWLDSLGKHGKLIVPQGAANRSGAYVTEVTNRNGKSDKITMMRWIEGSPSEGSLPAAVLEKMGSLMANLHHASDSFVPPEPFVRPVWGQQSFERDMMRLEQHYSRFLSDEEFKLYRLAAEKIFADLSGTDHKKHGFGMIHADLHAGNIVFHHGEPFPIDLNGAPLLFNAI